MPRHIIKGIAIWLVLMLLMVFAAAPVLAFDGRTGETVTVARGEVVEGDLYAMGRTIIIDGTVNGDIYAAGQMVTVNGTVNGGVTLAGQTVTVNGQVANGARLAGQYINVNGSIGRDVVAAGNTINVGSTAKIANSLVFGAATLYVSGQVNGNVRGGAGDATLTYEVGGNVDVTANSLTLTSTANIKGNLLYISKNEASIQPGAQIGGSTSHKLPEPKKPATPLSTAQGKILGFIMMLIAGVIIIVLAARRISAMADSIQTRPWPSLGWGVLTLVATPIAAIIVMCTVIGLPVGLIGLVVWGIAVYLSQIPVGFLIGRLILGRNREIETRGMMVGALALGLAILTVLGLVPYLGGLIGLLAIIFGLGSLIILVRRSRAVA